MKLNIRKLEKEREQLRLGKAAFSRHLGLTDSAYSKIMDSKSTTFERLTKIAEALSIDPKDLLI